MTFEPHAFAVAILQALSDERDYAKLIEVATTLLDIPATGDLDPQAEAAYRETLLSFASVASYNLDRFPESLGYAEQGVREGRRMAMPSITLARDLGNRALAKQALGDLVGAQEDYQEALTIGEDLNTDADPAGVLQRIRANYAHFLNDRGQRAEAWAVAALASSAGTDLMAHIDHAWMRAIIDRRPEESIRLFEVALRRTRGQGDLSKAGIAASNLGMAYHQLGDKEQARVYLTESAELLEQLAPSEHLAVTDYNLGVILGNLGQLDEAAVYLKRALDLFLQLTPRSLKILWVLRHIAMLRLVQKDYRRARAALRRGIELYESIRPNVGHLEGEQSGAFEIYRLLVELHLYLSLEEEWPDETFELIERSRARYWAETVTPLAPEPDVARFHPQGITNDTALDVLLLTYFVGPNATFMMYGRGGHLSSRRIDVGTDGLRGLVQNMTFDLLATPSRRGPREDTAKTLATMLLPDVDPTSVRAVLILPDGPLWALPFDALPLGDGTHLGDVAPVVSAPGIHVLRQMRGLRRRRRQEIMPVVVARPELAGHLPDLPGAERHAALLTRLFPATQVLPGPAATWAALREALPSATHVHVAAHALARAGEEPAVLLCDGHGRPVYVRVADIAVISLTADLVFLAACSTSLGATSSGEGLISIARAFLFAGARCVVGTLWQVPADETELLVSAFYESMADGATLIDSLHKAKCAARAGGLSPRTWAAFQGVGDFLADIDQMSAFLERFDQNGSEPCC